ncbi:uncharacterized protein MONOS_17287 [Monocercomonoides exilis]|uniref:uncharacterized protein n=1 Tax=Monocercomonoides exilis TaxID=2049356 RepID=UPI0035595D75|nr:hypothetical protein MONOS_17287 [Monocercomonoides exilis]
MTWGVFIESRTSQAKNGQFYTVWSLHDLSSTWSSLLLFGEAHSCAQQKLSEIHRSGIARTFLSHPVEGDLIYVANPKVLTSQKPGSISLSVDDASQIMLIGSVKDYGRCKILRKADGRVCNTPIDKRDGMCCVFHARVSQEMLKREKEEASHRETLEQKKLAAVKGAFIRATLREPTLASKNTTRPLPTKTSLVLSKHAQLMEKYKEAAERKAKKLKSDESLAVPEMGIKKVASTITQELKSSVKKAQEETKSNNDQQHKIAKSVDSAQKLKKDEDEIMSQPAKKRIRPDRSHLTSPPRDKVINLSDDALKIDDDDKNEQSNDQKAFGSAKRMKIEQSSDSLRSPPLKRSKLTNDSLSSSNKSAISIKKPEVDPALSSLAVDEPDNSAISDPFISSLFSSSSSVFPSSSSHFESKQEENKRKLQKASETLKSLKKQQTANSALPVKTPQKSSLSFEEMFSGLLSSDEKDDMTESQKSSITSPKSPVTLSASASNSSLLKSPSRSDAVSRSKASSSLHSAMAPLSPHKKRSLSNSADALQIDSIVSPSKQEREKALKQISAADRLFSRLDNIKGDEKKEEAKEKEKIEKSHFNLPIVSESERMSEETKAIIQRLVEEAEKEEEEFKEFEEKMSTGSDNSDGGIGMLAGNAAFLSDPTLLKDPYLQKMFEAIEIEEERRENAKWDEMEKEERMLLKKAEVTEMKVMVWWCSVCGLVSREKKTGYCEKKNEEEITRLREQGIFINKKDLYTYPKREYNNKNAQSDSKSASNVSENETTSSRFSSKFGTLIKEIKEDKSSLASQTDDDVYVTSVPTLETKQKVKTSSCAAKPLCSKGKHDSLHHLSLISTKRRFFTCTGCQKTVAVVLFPIPPFPCSKCGDKGKWKRSSLMEMETGRRRLTLASGNGSEDTLKVFSDSEERSRFIESFYSKDVET